MSAIGYLRAAFRFDEWWYANASTATAIALSLAIVTDTVFVSAVRTTLLGLIAIAALASFGFGVNDVADAAADRRSGKHRQTPLAELSSRTALLLLAPLVPIGLTAAGALGIGAMAIEAVGFLVAAAYSLEPMRLKERMLGGIVAIGCGMGLVPTAIYVVAFPRGNEWSWRLLSVGLLLWSGLAGMRGALVHQILDATNDRRAGLRTLVTVRGEKALYRIIEGSLFPAETAAFAVVAFALIDSSGWVALGVAPAVLSWFRVDPHRHPRWLGYRPLALADRIYRIWWPLSVAGALVMKDPRFLAAAAGYLLLFRTGLRRRLRHLIESLRMASRDRAAGVNTR